MRGLFLVIAVFLVVLTQAQVVCLNPEKNFGEINRDTDRVVDLQFVNRGDEKAFLLSYRFPREFSILPAAREVMPNDTLVIRYQLNPIEKGRFDKKVPIYFSSQQEPIEIRVKAQVDFIDPYTNPQCPSFDELAMANSDRNEVTFEVLDRQSGSPIKNASLRLIDRGEMAEKLTTDKKGMAQQVVPIAYYYMIAEADGYSMADSVSYINRRNNFFRFYLEPDLLVEIPPTPPEIEEPDIIITIDEEPPPPPPPPVVEIVVTEDIEDEYPTFSSREFKPNNIVFLIDVSGSMANKGKMDLLKASMIELLDMLRPIDQLTIVTYASRVEVLLPATPANNKEEIREIIKNLEARGSTAGALGVKKAFKLAKNQRIDGGNNQVIIATDGAFKTADKPVIDKTVKKYQRQRIDLSVVGIKSTNSVKEQLSLLANRGNGAFLPITSFDQASSVLVDEIRSKSRIKGDL